MFGLVKEKPYVIDRFENGEYVDGVWVEGDSVPVEIMAIIQPAKWNELQQFPEGERTKEWCKVFSKSLLRTQKEGTTPHGADRFTWQGDRYEVRKTKQWDVGHLDHYVAWAARVELAPDEDTL